LRLRIPALDGFVVATVVVFNGSLLEILVSGGQGSRPMAVRLVLLLIYALSIALVLRYRADRTLLIGCPLLAALIALPLLSVLWSVTPGLTLERAIGVVGTSAFGILLGSRYDLAQMLRLLAYALLINMLASLLLVLAVPSIGIERSGPWAGAWLGVYNHKNGLGTAAGLAILVFAYALLDAGPRLRLVLLSGLAIATLLLMGARSTTALVTTLLGVTLGLFLLLRQRFPAFRPLVLLVGVIMLPTLIFIAAEISAPRLVLEALGKDATLTSRVPIWQLAWPFVLDRFWLGYGFGAFWQPDLPWADQFEARLHFLPFYSHNGILELWLGCGVIAVALALTVYVLALLKAAIAQRNAGRSYVQGFVLVFLVSLALRNAVEASLLMKDDLLWAAFVALAVMLARVVRWRLRLGGAPAVTLAVPRSAGHG
jgi:O-antigen ligase